MSRYSATREYERTPISTTFYAFLLTWWFSTIPHTSSLEVWAVFVGLDFGWYITQMVIRRLWVAPLQADAEREQKSKS